MIITHEMDRDCGCYMGVVGQSLEASGLDQQARAVTDCEKLYGD